jgi:signal transduction histidine kinase
VVHVDVGRRDRGAGRAAHRRQHPVQQDPGRHPEQPGGGPAGPGERVAQTEAQWPGQGQSLPAGVELIAYRVVQEALTNAVKHAAGAAVTIVVTGTADELRVEVTDAGGSPSADSAGSGRGLAGLRERLLVYGGALTAGRRPTGGYRLAAVLPLRGDG